MAALLPKAYRERYPCVFDPDESDDLRTNQRQLRMRVLALGFSRSGTYSMRTALERLGLPTYHFLRIFRSVQDADLWNEAYEAKFFDGEAVLDRAYWDRLLGHVSAVTDQPCINFAAELIAAYPEAKVILWQRNEDTWFESWKETAIDTYGIFHWGFSSVVATIDPAWWGKIWPLVQRGIYEGAFRSGSQADLVRNSRAVYREHFATVRAALKDQPDRLLEYQMGEGWEPICKFLDMPTPFEPFPRVNDREAIIGLRYALMLRVLGRLLKRWGLILLLLLVLLVYTLY